MNTIVNAEIDLPVGWFITKLENIGEWSGGGTPSKSIEAFWKDGTIPWVSPKDMKSAEIIDSEDKITSTAIQNTNAKLLPANSVLFVVRSGILRRKLPVAINRVEVAINQDLQVFTPIQEIVLPEFVYWYAIGNNDKLLHDCAKSGTTVESIDSKLLKSYAISLPPLPEQHRIVNKLERLFARLTRAEASLASAETALERHQQSVLNTAFKAEDEEGNLKEGWKWVKLGEVCQINPKFSKPIVNEKTTVSFIPMKCVEEESGRVNLSEKRPFFELKKGFTPFENGDVIFAKITPCMENGKVAVLKNLENGIGFGSTEFYVFRCSERLDNRFLFYFLVRKIFREEAKHHFSGAVGQQRVPKGFLENKAFPLPLLPIQKALVKSIETAWEKSESLQDYLLTAQNECALLRQSVLQTAFSGKLVNQSKEDEPAEVLLRRIKETMYNVSKAKGSKQKA